MQYNISEYKELLSNAKTLGYDFVFYGNEDKEIENKCILRHDIDTELLLIDPILDIEKELDIHATYFIMMRSTLYNPFCIEAKRIISKILEHGHQLGLHYMGEMFLGDLDKISKDICREKEILENEFDTSVNVVSFHQPSKKFLEAEIKIPGLINTYNKDQMKNYNYFSDSNMRLSKNDLKNLFLNGSNNKIQLLIHPIWWISNSQDIIKKWKNVLNENQLVQIKHLISRERTLSNFQPIKLQK